jgi:hypothetical protein
MDKTIVNTRVAGDGKLLLLHYSAIRCAFSMSMCRTGKGVRVPRIYRELTGSGRANYVSVDIERDRVCSLL